MTETPQANLVADNRSRSWGWGRLVIAVFWIFGIVATGFSLWGLNDGSDVPLGPRLISLVAGVVYLMVALGMTHNGRRMRIIAWVGLIISLVGPVIVAIQELGFPSYSAAGLSPWSRFGGDYWYLPMVLPIVGLVWMWWSDPRRIVEIAEGIERIERPRRG